MKPHRVKLSANPLRSSTPPRSPVRRRGFTFIEVMVAVAISALVIAGVLSVGLMVKKIYKSTMSQQIALYNAKKSIEVINREIRRAEVPLSLNGWGNRVEFHRYGETTTGSLELLAGDDADIATPWDNSLVYDPNTTTSGDEVVISNALAPATTNGAFNYAGGVQPLIVRMRAGDPVDDECVAHTGLGIQGVEINITVGPRN